MKKLISSALILLLLFFSATGKAANKQFSESAVNKTGQLLKNTGKPLEMYFWIFDGPCLQLVRLNPPGYTDAQGNYWPSASLTFMGPLNYIGTTRICPPEGQAYC